MDNSQKNINELIRSLDIKLTEQSLIITALTNILIKNEILNREEIEEEIKSVYQYFMEFFNKTEEEKNQSNKHIYFGPSVEA